MRRKGSTDILLLVSINLLRVTAWFLCPNVEKMRFVWSYAEYFVPLQPRSETCGDELGKWIDTHY